MKMNQFVSKAKLATGVATVLAGSAFFMSACTGGGGADSSTANSRDPLTISGTLGATLASTQNVKATSETALAINASDLKIYGVAISSAGVSAKAVDVGSTGAFTLTLENAKGALVTLLFIDKTTCSNANDPATCDPVGQVKFTDDSKKDINGKSKSSSSIALTGDVSLGNIAISASGEVSVPVAQIASSISTTVSAGVTAFDFSGVWASGKYTGTLPTGYKTIKTIEEQMADQNGGGGPFVGMPLTLIRLSGKEFTPNGSCTSSTVCPADAGTNGDQVYGISIWAGGITAFGSGQTAVPSQLAACDGKTGFSAEDARFNARINLDTPAPTISGQGTSLALGYGDYGWDTPTGVGGDPDTASDGAHPNNLPWMKDDATPPMWWQVQGSNTDYRVQKCFAKMVGTAPNQQQAWVCESYADNDDSGTLNGGDTDVWQAGLGGGCFDSTGKPLQVTNWGAMQGQGVVCNQVNDATLPSGFKSNECTYTNMDPDGTGGVQVNGTVVVNNPAMTFTCRHSGGMFTNSNLSTPYDPSAGGAGTQWHRIIPKEQIVQHCHQVTDTLTRYRCYAEAYHNNGGGGGGPQNWSSCAKDYRFNWGATTPEAFVMSDTRNKPDGAFITNTINYSPDGTSASVYDERKEIRTVGGDGKEVFCPIVRTTNIKVTKVSDSRLLVDLNEGGRIENLSNEACVAAAKTEFKYELQQEKMLFYLDKM